MFDNRVAQPLVVAATLGMWEALRAGMPSPALVAGYSIGELSAHAVTGALDPLEAVELAAQRARLMDDAARAAPGQAMAAISAVPLERAAAISRQAGFDIAIVTGEDACIVGGRADALAQLEAAFHGLAGRVQALPVRIASHTPLMAAAVPALAAALDGATFRSPASPVLAGIDASRVRDKEAAVRTLSRQIAQPIQWSACMDAAVEMGVNVALELGPGAALSRMMQARHPGVACRSASEFRSIDGILAWVGRQFG